MSEQSHSYFLHYIIFSVSGIPAARIPLSHLPRTVHRAGCPRIDNGEYPSYHSITKSVITGLFDVLKICHISSRFVSYRLPLVFPYPYHGDVALGFLGSVKAV